MFASEDVISWQAGKMMVNVDPWPGRLSARMRPWWASTISRQTARPEAGSTLTARIGRLSWWNKTARRCAEDPQVQCPMPVSDDADLDAAAGAGQPHTQPHHTPLRHRLAGVQQEG